MNTFDSIIKNSFIKNFDGTITEKTIVISLAITLVMALYLFLVYRLFSNNALYNRDFNLSLVGMAVVTAAIVLAIQSNLVLSLGMVGALSIVRYRSAVKNPKDLFFLFWAIADGIMCGAGQYTLSFLVTFILSIVLLLLTNLPTMKSPFILVVNANSTDSETIKKCISQHCPFFKVKSSFVSNGKIRMIVDIKTKNQDALLEELGDMSGVSASIVTYEGDIV